MSIAFDHHHDHATVAWPETLTPAASAELVATIDSVLAAYFYREVELVIVAAAGGHIGALKYLHESLARSRAGGVRIRTRVVSSAESAAALVLSLGDERIAEPGAMMLYHPVRIPEVTSLTAHDCAMFGMKLERIDELWTRQLVERAMEKRGPRGEHRCAPGDASVLRRLVGSKGRGRRSVDALARRLERRVEAAVARGDRASLARLYRRLFEMDVPISAPVAHRLRLIDRIGPAPASDAPPTGPVGLTVPEWRALYPPEGAIPRAMLTRHTLILGETGSGKTVSGILPVVGAMARAPAGAMGCGRVIDPKRDLRAVLERIAPERLRTVTTDAVVLDVMAGPRWRLGADLAAGRWRSATVRILHRVASFSPASPARVFAPHEPGNSNAEFFNREGCELPVTVLVLVAMLTASDAPEPEEWLAYDPKAREWVERLRAKADGEDGMRGPNALALAAWVLGDGVMHRSRSETAPPSSFDDDDAPRPQRWLLARIAAGVLDDWDELCGEGREVLERIGAYWDRIARTEGQYPGTLAAARSACSEFAAPAIARSLYFGFEPGYAEARDEGATLDLSMHVAPDAAPAIVALPALGRRAGYAVRDWSQGAVLRGRVQ